VTTFSRADWGASPLEPGGSKLTGPLITVVVHHTVTQTPTTVEAAMASMRAMQRYHIGTNGWSDIGYSWVVDEGNAYEGRGWLRSGAHTQGHNSTAHAIAWMGNSEESGPSTAAVAAIAQLITDGQRAGAITMAPRIVGHRDLNPGATACPGRGLAARLDEIRAAVIDGFSPATKPTPEDPMTDDDRKFIAAELAKLSAQINSNDTHLVDWIRAVESNVRTDLADIRTRLGAIEAGEVPTPEQLAEALVHHFSQPKEQT